MHKYRYENKGRPMTTFDQAPVVSWVPGRPNLIVTYPLNASDLTGLH